ncbi:MAG: hypothetical protein V1676_04900 [Candidatus Diapherotrites archaeon]
MGMPLLQRTETVARAPNFSAQRAVSCMNCGKAIEGGNNTYSRRFCSDACRLSYLL